MVKLTDPDSLNQGTEVVISTAAKTIQLLVAGTLDDTNPGSTSGVTGQVIFSFLKEEWKTDAALGKFKFPLKMFTSTDGILQNGWQWADAQTRQLVRDFGWEESVGAEAGDQYACIISLGSFDATADQGYYANIVGFDQITANFDKTGNLNEAILIKDADGVDYTSYLKPFLRIQGKLYDEYDLLSEQGFSLLEPVVYRLPLSNSTDLKIDESDGNIDTLSPYTGMSQDYLSGEKFVTMSAIAYIIDDVVQDTTGRWFICTIAGTATGTDVATGSGTCTFVSYVGERQIGTLWYAFNRITDGNSITNGTAQEIYNWQQRQLRKTGDINGNASLDNYGTINGNVAIPLSNYLGDTLQTNPGNYIDNFDVNDKNSIEFFDITVDSGGVDANGVPLISTKQIFPFTSAGNMGYSANLVTETNADTKYTMYYKYTRTQTETDVAISGAAGSAATIGSTNIDLTNIDSGQYFTVSGFANAVNNGLWLATGNGLADTVAATKVDGATVIDEIATPSVTLQQNPYDTEGAIIVDDNGGSDITGQVSAASIAFDYKYDGNIQGNRAAGSDAVVVIQAQGLFDSEWIDAEFTITRTTGLTFNVTAGDERNYDNP